MRIVITFTTGNNFGRYLMQQLILKIPKWKNCRCISQYMKVVLDWRRVMERANKIQLNKADSNNNNFISIKFTGNKNYKIITKELIDIN